MSRNGAFNEGAGRSDPSNIAIEATRQHHARHFKVDPDLVSVSAHDYDGDNPHVLPRHYIAVTHPDPETFEPRTTDWVTHASDAAVKQESPPVMVGGHGYHEYINDPEAPWNKQ